MMMRRYTIVSTLLLLSTLVTVTPAGDYDATVRAFENNADYIRPFATLIGTMTNSGWYQSAGIDKEFGFYVGLPISITYISEKDRSFEYTYIDKGCQECNKQGGSNQGCIEAQTVTVPTVFGRDKAPTIRVVKGLDMNANVTSFRYQYFSDGVDEISQVNWLPYVSLQLGFSYYHTALNMRFITVPLDEFSLTLPSFSLQHDLQTILPDLPFRLSVAANLSIISASWTPADGNISGEIKLSGLSNFVGVLAGYRLGILEAFLETGWEHSFLKTSGSATIAAENASEEPELITPSVELTGRNAFRIGLNLAIDIGYSAVIGHSFGSEMNTTINILGFKYQKK